jgi:hypothetical protein
MKKKKSAPKSVEEVKPQITIPGLISGKQLFLAPQEKRHYLLDGLLPYGVMAGLVGSWQSILFL